MGWGTARSVIKIVLQFCKENGLSQTYQTLQTECQVAHDSAQPPHCCSDSQTHSHCRVGCAGVAQHRGQH